MRLLIQPRLPSTLIFLAFFVTSCGGFSSKCRISLPNPPSESMTILALSSSASMPPAGKDLTEIKIAYRSARQTDVTAIAGLLHSVFEDEEKLEEEGDNSNENSDNNTFMWDSLIEKSNKPQISPEEQFDQIQSQLAKRMMDAKKEDSLPHLFLVATISASDDHATNEQDKENVVGFLEMGTLPPPISGSPIGNAELPYIGNVAVSTQMRRRKIGKTLVRLATKIAAKWCTPSPNERPSSFPPFLFLSVERDNLEALKFYEKLGFEELKVAKQSIDKIYLAQGLD
mmetsp:Transcript_6662/g.16387  ORF Transcript_6662/g.16387 Transcript_6662/m.16387 type:complete len:285 (+) Transcript_6662:136-990(+)|eukprot:CAMPEP_0197185466 /NCGR_PEP_ID=MMETSP1423-20130617/11989_1 /TAXON_ID=476441 /ORGANISM="Pseudo-nitzschia heimii, Strain UNC1101" /LENGTH=284 /DNA_ID=CAMNT_0042636537 /DNA_START=54 /DNA_END=908 /DNA_ORIENTATION=-